MGLHIDCCFKPVTEEYVKNWKHQFWDCPNIRSERENINSGVCKGYEKQTKS